MLTIKNGSLDTLQGVAYEDYIIDSFSYDLIPFHVENSSVPTTRMVNESTVLSQNQASIYEWVRRLLYDNYAIISMDKKPLFLDSESRTKTILPGCAGFSKDCYYESSQHYSFKEYVLHTKYPIVYDMRFDNLDNSFSINYLTWSNENDSLKDKHISWLKRFERNSKIDKTLLV